MPEQNIQSQQSVTRNESVLEDASATDMPKLVVERWEISWIAFVEPDP